MRFCSLAYQLCIWHLQYVLEGMLVYPNKMDFPVMENFGVTPPPLGMLEITIDRAEGLPNSDFLSKSDPYCEVRNPGPGHTR